MVALQGSIRLIGVIAPDAPVAVGMPPPSVVGLGLLASCPLLLGRLPCKNLLSCQSMSTIDRGSTC